jgi:Arc/MetJ-type ribon-helix-helix transcriptional regulator
MQPKLKPETLRFIDEQVTAGRFRNSDELLDEAVSRMMADDEFDLDGETVAAIKEAEEQIEKGEYVSLDELVAEMRRKMKSRRGNA